MKKTFLILFLALCVPALFAQTAAQMPKAVVTVGEVQEAEDVQTRRYPGQVISPAVVNITSRVQGEIVNVHFQDGMVVEKDAVLYTLDSTQYYAAVMSARAVLAQAQSQLLYAAQDYKRRSSLYEQGVSTTDELESAAATLGMRKAVAQAAEAALLTAEDNLKHTVIRAPIRGIIGVNKFAAGNYVTPSSGTLVTLIQISPLRVRFSIGNRDLMRLFATYDELANHAHVSIELPNGTIYSEKGTFELINNEANARTDAIQLFVRYENANRQLLVGSTVTVTLKKESGKRLPAVRPSTILHDAQGAYVYMLDANNCAVKRRVKLGNISDDWQLISEGLTKGEKVVTDGMHKIIMDGMPLLPQDEKNAVNR